MVSIQNKIKEELEIAEKAKEELREQIKELEMKLSDKEHEIASKQDEIYVIQQDLENAWEEAKKAPARELQDAYTKAKQDIEKKDQKITSLNKVVHQLKSSLMDAAKEAAESKIKESNVAIQVQQLLQTQTSSLNEKITKLESKLAVTTAAHHKMEKEYREVEKDSKRLSDELKRFEHDINLKDEKFARLKVEFKKIFVENTKLKANNGGSQPQLEIDFSWLDAEYPASEKDAAKQQKWEHEKKLTKKIEVLKTKLLSKVSYKRISYYLDKRIR